MQSRRTSDSPPSRFALHNAMQNGRPATMLAVIGHASEISRTVACRRSLTPARCRTLNASSGLTQRACLFRSRDIDGRSWARRSSVTVTGAHIWLRLPQSPQLGVPPMPEDAYYFLGHDQQIVAIVPSRDLVIVRLGHTQKGSDWDHAILAAFPPVEP
jgi:CubicO group peptidase (beta-lactamase class C family)